MQTFKKLVSKISKQSLFQQIIESKQLKQQKFTQAIQQYSHFSSEKQQSVMKQILNTFKRQKSTKIIITTLLLIDYLYSLSPEITLFHNCSQPKISKEQSFLKKNLLVNQKIFVAEEHFIKFYFNFLKESQKKTTKEIDFQCCDLKEWISYCEISINQILELIKIDFVFSFLIKNSQSNTLVKMCLQSIFQKVSFDIRIINRFLQKNLRIITKKHQQSFKVNQIYQKLLFSNKNFLKFTAITKNLSKKISFQEYEVDKDLNKSIQKQMYQREDEKRDYLISSRKKIQVKEKHTSFQQDKTQGLTVEGDTMVRLNQFV